MVKSFCQWGAGGTNLVNSEFCILSVNVSSAVFRMVALTASLQLSIKYLWWESKYFRNHRKWDVIQFPGVRIENLRFIYYSDGQTENLYSAYLTLRPMWLKYPWTNLQLLTIGAYTILDLVLHNVPCNDLTTLFGKLAYDPSCMCTGPMHGSCGHVLQWVSTYNISLKTIFSVMFGRFECEYCRRIALWKMQRTVVHVKRLVFLNICLGVQMFVLVTCLWSCKFDWELYTVCVRLSTVLLSVVCRWPRSDMSEAGP
jgi:hypothetical protein